MVLMQCHIFNLDLPPSTLWKNFRKYGLTKGSSRVPTEFSPSDFSNYFESVTARNKTQYFNIKDNSDDYDHLHFANVSNFEIWYAVREITSESIGSDDIPIRFIKMLMPIILNYVTHIVNTCITRSTFPEIWKLAFVVPINKIKNPNQLTDFRPISILPCLSKILEKILKEQICGIK